MFSSSITKSWPSNPLTWLSGGSLIFISAVMLTSLLTLLTGCDASSDASQSSTSMESETASLATTSDLSKASDLSNDSVEDASNADTVTSPLSQTAPTTTRNSPLTIDWSKIDSKVDPVATDEFNYPFAIDSAPVQSYADFFKVSPAEAQQGLILGTASNEPLSLLLDQLGDSYVSHEYIDGKDNKLVIHTTENVTASKFDYVMADDFARGLVLPINILPVQNNDK